MAAPRHRRTPEPGTLAREPEAPSAPPTATPLAPDPERLGTVLPQLDPASRARTGQWLQAAHGNAYVQRLARQVTATKPPAKQKAPAAPPKEFTTDADGYISAKDAAGASKRVGHAPPGGAAYVCVSGSEVGVPFADAQIGTLTPGGEIVAARKAVVEADPDTAGAVKVKASAPTLGVLFDSATETFKAPVLQKGKGWEPLPWAKLDATVQTALTGVPEPHLKLTSGQFWALMEFTLKGDTTARREWAGAKHKELEQARTTVEKDMEAMPDALKEQVEDYIGTITSVMAHEGSYGARSPGSDYMASIGIFQWGMHKNKASKAGSSMGKFFADLKRRATPPPAGAKPTPEQQLYIDAWAQCTKHGIDVTASGVVSVNGKTATGAQIEDLLSGKGGEMAKGALRQYQLVAAKDWIEEFAANPVRPGPSFPSWVGHGYSEPKTSPQGLKVKLTFPRGSTKYAFELEAPADTATVGSTFPTQKNVALAVTLGANRPHYVEAALWRALTGKREVKDEVATLLGAIVDAREKAEAAAAAAEPAAGGTAGKSKPKPKPKAKKGGRKAVSAADAAGWGAQTQYDALLRLIWPASRELDDAAEEQMATQFKKEGLQLYKKKDAERFKRWKRFATVEAAFDE